MNIIEATQHFRKINIPKEVFEFELSKQLENFNLAKSNNGFLSFNDFSKINLIEPLDRMMSVRVGIYHEFMFKINSLENEIVLRVPHVKHCSMIMKKMEQVYMKQIF